MVGVLSGEVKPEDVESSSHSSISWLGIIHSSSSLSVPFPTEISSEGAESSWS